MRTPKSCVQLAYWNYAIALLSCVDDYVPLAFANELLYHRKLQMENAFSTPLMQLSICYDRENRVYKVYQNSKPVGTRQSLW